SRATARVSGERRVVSVFAGLTSELSIAKLGKAIVLRGPRYARFIAPTMSWGRGLIERAAALASSRAAHRWGHPSPGRAGASDARHPPGLRARHRVPLPEPWPVTLPAPVGRRADA